MYYERSGVGIGPHYIVDVDRVVGGVGLARVALPARRRVTACLVDDYVIKSLLKFVLSNFAKRRQ